MKTAMQQLIEEMESLKNLSSENVLNDCIHLAYAKLPIEKQQIIYAAEAMNPMSRIGIDGERYFKDNFEQ